MDKGRRRDEAAAALLAQPHSADPRRAPLGRVRPPLTLLQREVSIYSDPIPSEYYPAEFAPCDEEGGTLGRGNTIVAHKYQFTENF